MTVEGVALCLSGGGYRAMLFHLGALIRLNELGILRILTQVSSVSGGSITAGVLGLHWRNLKFDGGVAQNFECKIVDPILAMSERTIDVWAILTGLLLPGSIASRVARAYDHCLFHGASLQDLPADTDGPRFVINATSVQSGALWRFSRPYMADYRVGRVPNPQVPLAVAVAASSASPPFLSPLRLPLSGVLAFDDESCDLHTDPYIRRAVLTDGGAYDNLGLKTAWKKFRTVLAGDGGAPFSSQPGPKRAWLSHMRRALDLIYNQVCYLRKRQLIGDFANPNSTHDGTYWGICTKIANYGLADALPCPVDRVADLAGTPTRLSRLDKNRQQRLINWGYAVCDAAIRRHCPTLAHVQAKARFPYACGV